MRLDVCDMEMLADLHVRLKEATELSEDRQRALERAEGRILELELVIRHFIHQTRDASEIAESYL